MTIAFPKAGPITLKTHLAEYPVTHALRAGEIKSDLVTLDFVGPKQAYEGFKPMVRESAYDASELAIVTFLQAKAFGKPFVALPAFVLGRFQHNLIGYNAGKGELAPKDLEGKRVGVRAYTQTTGVWLRGILQHEYGVDLGKVKFVTFEDPHVTEYNDPPGVERAGATRRSATCCSPASSTPPSWASCRPIRASACSFPIPTPPPGPGTRNTARCR